MTDEEALYLVDAVLKNISLGNLQELVFRQVWNGQSYGEIASSEGYSPEYIKRVGALLWRSLSDAFGEKVTRSNVRSILRRYATQQYKAYTHEAINEIAVIDQADEEPYLALSEVHRKEATDTVHFHGRTEELLLLQQWMIADHCQLITLFGIGGIGKTALAKKLVDKVEAVFECVIWRSLRHAPRLESLLSDLVSTLSRGKDTLSIGSLDDSIMQVLQYLRDRRCLLVLDQGESILQAGIRSRAYRAGYEGYRALFHQIGQGVHESCLLLISREKPPESEQQAGKWQLTRSLQVQGLSLTDAQMFLKASGWNGSESIQQNLIQRYQGNPLALRSALDSIRDLFDYNTAAFLSQTVVIFNGVRHLLNQQFERLDALEQQVMYWLSINREPVSASEIQADLFPPVPLPDVLEALESLLGRSLVERLSNGFSLQPMVMEYVGHRFLERIRAELLGEIDEEACFLQLYALLKAEAKESIRQSQIQLILKPLADWMLVRFGSLAHCQTQLAVILERLRTVAAGRGYGGGNLMNLLRQLEGDLTGWNFSNLAIWQADLSGVRLHRVNFSGADLSKSIFTQSCGGIVAIAFHPDGHCLATTDTEGRIHLWQVSNGRLLQRWKGHSSWASAIAFSPDGEILASGGVGDEVKLWQVKTRQCLKTLPGHKDQVWSICFGPDGQQLAVADYSPTVRIWNVQTGTCDRIFEGHSQPVWSVVYAQGTVYAKKPDDLILVSGSLDGTIKFWEPNTGACLQTLEHGHPIKSLAVSADYSLLAVGSVDTAIRLWNLQTGEAIAPLQGHTDQVWGIAFSPNSHALDNQSPLLISGSFDQTLRFWDVNTGQCLRTLQGHTNAIWAIAASPQGNILVSGGLDHSIRFWDMETGQGLRVLQGYALEVWAIAYAPVSEGSNPPSLLASGGSDHQVRLWDTDTGKAWKVLQGHQSQVWSVAFHPQGQILASGSLDHTVKVWQVRTGRCIQTLRDHCDWVSSVVFSPDGEFLVSGSTDRTVRLWDIETGDCLRALVHPSQVWSVVVTPDSQRVISGCLDRTIRIWEVATGECLNVLAGHSHMVWAIALSPDGYTLASGSLDNTVKLWNIETGECLQTLEGHTNHVVAVAFSQDGKTVASSATDNLVRLWDIQTGNCSQILRKHRSMVRSLAFHPKNHHLASASADKTIRLWDCETGKPLQVLRSDRPYEGMNVVDVAGLTEAQQENLVELGAIDYIEEDE